MHSLISLYQHSYHQTIPPIMFFWIKSTFACSSPCRRLVLAMSHLWLLSLFICLEHAFAARVVPLPRDRSMSPMSAQNSDRLAFSTPTSISAVSMLNLGVANDVTFQASEVVHEDNYVIDEFSISFKDNLALYGKNTIYARPIG